jgi:hypothetical protein
MSALPKSRIAETSNTYARGLLQGIVAYIHEHRPWSIYLAEHSRGQRLPGRAATDLPIGKYDYGGLFIRMP